MTLEAAVHGATAKQLRDFASDDRSNAWRREASGLLDFVLDLVAFAGGPLIEDLRGTAGAPQPRGRSADGTPQLPEDPDLLDLWSKLRNNQFAAPEGRKSERQIAREFVEGNPVEGRRLYEKLRKQVSRGAVPNWKDE
jgi:hypothetical protein